MLRQRCNATVGPEDTTAQAVHTILTFRAPVFPDAGTALRATLAL
ncbi:hypothetical protein GCM10022263_13750 [Nocardioides daeguensis]|uniref:Uncharacterized protein n=1 Tax=Nocardioides daeguensis TaxID=908359 RepID=A0ABP6V122_9ACTN